MAPMQIKNIMITPKKHGYDAADKWRKETIGKFKPYTIKTDEEAFQHADRFAADVS